MSTSTSPYRRVLLKLSGETFADETTAISPEIVGSVADQLVEVSEQGTQIGVVVGGGNILRGASLSATGVDRSSADHMGMLATVINALALQDACEKRGVNTRVQSAVAMQELAEPYIRRRAVRHLEKGRIVIFAAGLGAPYFSTDTAAAQRALEIDAEAILKGTKVDGVYDADPATNPDAKKYDKLSYLQVLADELKVMDATAISLCKDNDLPIIVFDMMTEGNIRRAIAGEPIGTLVERSGDTDGDSQAG